MEKDAFFIRDGAGFLANPVSRGPWNPQSLHGRVIIGLLAFAIEERHGDAAYTPARLTVDMYRLPDFSPLTVETRAVRDGYRIKVIEAELFSGGASVGRAVAQLLRRTEEPPGRVWTRPDWDAPAPDQLTAPAADLALGGMWAMRAVEGRMGAVGPRRTWMSEVRELVAGAPLTPWMRAALACDFASPFANAGEAGLAYINTDVTLYLSRPPAGEWIGFEVADHQSSQGVAIGECWLYDTLGPIGSASVCALAQKRAMGPGAPAPG